MAEITLVLTDDSTFESPTTSVVVEKEEVCWACEAARQYDQQPGDVAVFRNETTGETRTVRAVFPPFAFFCEPRA